MSKLSNGQEQEVIKAMELRRQLTVAGLTKRELLKMGLMAGGMVALPTKGAFAKALKPPFLPLLSGGGGGQVSPPTQRFVEPMPRMVVKQPEAGCTPSPTQTPNTTPLLGANGQPLKDVNGLPVPCEGRKLAHQAWTSCPVKKTYEVIQQAAPVWLTPSTGMPGSSLPIQQMWGFDGMVPGPLYKAYYGEPMMVRNHNNLPANNGGYGKNSVSTHLHNSHSPAESDGGPCYFFEPGQFYDHHYPNVLAGFNSDHPGTNSQGLPGDINESMSTLWYHDHRVDFTSQNVYKGLAGMYNLYNPLDCDDETNGNGFRLPAGPQTTNSQGQQTGSEFDVNIMLNDKVFDPSSGLLFFDLFNLDGILGDKFVANGKIQPFFQVKARRYRFRVLNGGPSRFYEMFLTSASNPSQVLPFWQVSNDGNLLPAPVQVKSVRMGVAERVDIIIDFSQFQPGTSIYFENRMEQTDGRGPTGKTLQAGQGNQIIRFDVIPLPTGQVDQSLDPAKTAIKYYDLPDSTANPRIVRKFNFERTNGQWSINGQFMSCTPAAGQPGNFNSRLKVQQNSVEHWILRNSSGGWQHPIHIHFEEHQVLSINGRPPSSSPLVQTGRKDVIRLEFNTEVKLFFRFRDFKGVYPMHCHNVVHEDHAMMLLWEIADVGDNNTAP